MPGEPESPREKSSHVPSDPQHQTPAPVAPFTTFNPALLVSSHSQSSSESTNSHDPHLAPKPKSIPHINGDATNGMLRKNSLEDGTLTGTDKGKENHKVKEAVTTSPNGRGSPNANPRMTASKYGLSKSPSMDDITYRAKSKNNRRLEQGERNLRSVSGSISRLARKSWISPSPLPAKNTRSSNDTRDYSLDITSEKTFVRSKSSISDSIANKNVQSAPASPSRRSSLRAKRPRRPLSTLLRGSSSDIRSTSTPSLPSSISTDRLAAAKHSYSSSEKPPSLPHSVSSERVQASGTETPRRKDELHGAFRGAEAEYQKFQTQSTNNRMATIRHGLLPFLKGSAEHSSNTNLRPEDLDRRISILNRWWTALLEMLNGRQGEMVSGPNRPVVLEAASAIMTRSEWTIPYRGQIPRLEKSPRASLKSRSTTSLGSMASDFLADSVFHNTKNIYNQNLLAQMAFVVERMSARTVPISVVNFCGKAAAYAFFYCDGIADILVRLWSTPLDTMRRVLDISGISPDSDMTSVSDRVAPYFPTYLQPLAPKSLRRMARYLRTQPQVPVATMYIPWNGPWIVRWTGKDTDLFFVFVRCYYNIYVRFHPDALDTVGRICVPGWMLIHAQLLTIVDATILRFSWPTFGDHQYPSIMRRSEVLGGTDAFAAVLPPPPNSVARSMAENRLIMLLRECLSETSTMVMEARALFANSFEDLLRATAKRTSVFDHGSCFVLCDLIEEAFVILHRFHQRDPAYELNWDFWLQVCIRLMESQNSMTIIRLFSFLYGLWGTIVADETRKEEVCLGWLLKEDIFDKNFNHWSPMVRAYFMRLLCWRVSRTYRRDSGIDIAILKVLHVRLQSVWSSLLYMEKEAKDNGLALPSTTACRPAPNRCLFIVRNDAQPASGGAFITFDSIISGLPDAQASYPGGHRPADRLSQSELIRLSRPRDDLAKDASPNKTKWSLFRSMFPFTGSASDRSKYASAHRETLDSSGHKAENARARGIAASGPAEQAKTYQNHSFKFTLEWDESQLNTASQDTPLGTPKLPRPAQDQLVSTPSLRHCDELLKPAIVAGQCSKYAGRALAEWAALVRECEAFFEKRITEGVPEDRLVETPTLGVESFRKLFP